MVPMPGNPGFWVSGPIFAIFVKLMWNHLKWPFSAGNQSMLSAQALHHLQDRSTIPTFHSTEYGRNGNQFGDL
jgi:hypothetical protein